MHSLDQKLIAWARAVKARQPPGVPSVPPLWLFTDARRGPDPLPAIAALPPRLCGVVFRHDDVPDRADLARRVARLCRARRLALVIAGDARLAAALGAGLHLRGGRRPQLGRNVTVRGAVTASAHSIPELRRASVAGAWLLFLSRFAASESHPGEAALGPVRWALFARRSRIPVLGLGGIDGRSVRRMPRFSRGAGAIGALL